MAESEIKQITEIGFVQGMKAYVVYVEGIPLARIDDILVSEKGARAMVLSLDHERLTALRLDSVDLRPGDRFQLSDKKFIFPATSRMFGRVLNPLGLPLDGKGGVAGAKTDIALDVSGLGIAARESIHEQFSTGITVLDMLLPIGKGQRELMIGPLQSGKTTFMRDVIVNQQRQGRICVYTAIGKSASAVQKFADAIFSAGAAEYTVIIAANASETVPIISLAPKVALGIADYFRAQGNDVLVVLDDLGTHAKYLREVGLMSGTIPGRGSYPGDIFYQHAHLMERAGNFNAASGGGSITLLPVMETDIENFTELIPTNLMASTDGHLFFSQVMRAKGFYPPVEIERSITRVGRQTQTEIQKSLGERIRRLLAKYRELQDYARFGSEVSGETQEILRQGSVVTELLRQDAHEYIDIASQAALLGLGFTTFLKREQADFVRRNRKKMIAAFKSKPFQDVLEMVVKNRAAEDFYTLLETKTPYLDKLFKQAGEEMQVKSSK